MWPHDVLARLGARPTGRPQTWWASCPLHDRRNRKLSVWMADGRLLLGCWGCRTRASGWRYKEEILAALGLTMGDLFDPQDRKNGLPEPHVQPRIVAVYPYTDEAGEVLYEKVRYQPKDFRVRRPGGRPGIGDARRVPYLLPELLARPTWPVLYVEGEKDAEAASAMGFLATTTMDGAGSGWGLDSPYPAHFAGRRVVVIPDEDHAGLCHARQVIGALVMAGAASVRLCRLPGLEYTDRGGPDLSDWLAGFTSRREAWAALVAAVRASREWR